MPPAKRGFESGGGGGEAAIKAVAGGPDCWPTANADALLLRFGSSAAGAAAAATAVAAASTSGGLPGAN
jgi:hypothetical protein